MDKLILSGGPCRTMDDKACWQPFNGSTLWPSHYMAHMAKYSMAVAAPSHTVLQGAWEAKSTATIHDSYSNLQYSCLQYNSISDTQICRMSCGTTTRSHIQSA